MPKKGSSGLLIALGIIAVLGAAVWFFWPEIKSELRGRDMLPERLESYVKRDAPAPKIEKHSEPAREQTEPAGRYSLSITDSSGRLAKAGRIMQFEMKLHGYVVSSVNVPKGWEVSVTNDSVALVKGKIVVGAAAVEKGGLRDLLVLEKISSKPGADVVVYTTRDFERKEKHALEDKEIAVRRM